MKTLPISSKLLKALLLAALLVPFACAADDDGPAEPVWQDAVIVRQGGDGHRLLDDGGQLGGAGLEVGDLVLEDFDLGREFAAELDDLVHLGVGRLEFIQGLELLGDAHLGISESLLQGDESFVLVDRGVHLLDGFLGCHKGLV